MTLLREIVVADTETTGVDPATDSLLEIAHVHVDLRSREITVADWTYIEYTGSIPPEAKAVHHIDESDVAPGGYRVAPRGVHVGEMLNMERREEGLAWCFHNAKFDLGFLPELTRPTICTYRCALHVWPDAPSHKNQVLRYWLGLSPDPELLDGLSPHRALYDSAVTAEILLKLLEERSAEELVELTKRPVLLTKVPFGKHRGDDWTSVPRSYLDWMRRSGNWSDDVDIMFTLDTIQGYDLSKYRV